MPTTPSGSLSLPQQYLKVLLSECTAFQTWCGAADAAAALNHIYLIGLPGPADYREYADFELVGYRPFAIINLVKESGFRTGFTAFGGQGFQFHPSGRLELHLEQAAPPLPETGTGGAVDIAEADLIFQNSVGAIIDGMCELAGRDGKLAIDEIGVREGPFRSREEATAGQGDFQWCVLEVAWGATQQ